MTQEDAEEVLEKMVEDLDRIAEHGALPQFHDTEKTWGDAKFAVRRLIGHFLERRQARASESGA